MRRPSARPSTDAESERSEIPSSRRAARALTRISEDCFSVGEMTMLVLWEV